MLGIKLILGSLFFAIISAGHNIREGEWVLIYMGIGLALLIAGLIVKDKVSVRDSDDE